MRLISCSLLLLGSLLPFAACSSSTTYVVAGDGGPNTGGGGAVACEQKSGADTDEDCASFTGKPRKLDCDSADTDSAIAAGCTRINAGGSDVCCPTTVRGNGGGGDGGGGGGGDGGGGGSCSTNYAGSWSLTGSCPVADCDVTQTGCNLVIACDGSTSLSGTVSGSMALLNGTSNGSSITCTISFSSASAFSLSCGSVCSGSGTKGGGGE